MMRRSVIRLVTPDPALEHKPSTTLMKRLGLGPVLGACAETSRKLTADPYLLLLLADQELTEGRDEQARCLVEAAYAVFDRRAEATRYPFNLAG